MFTRRRYATSAPFTTFLSRRRKSNAPSPVRDVPCSPSCRFVRRLLVCPHTPTSISLHLSTSSDAPTRVCPQGCLLSPSCGRLTWKVRIEGVAVTFSRTGWESDGRQRRGEGNEKYKGVKETTKCFDFASLDIMCERKYITDGYGDRRWLGAGGVWIRYLCGSCRTLIIRASHSWVGGTW